MLHLSSLSSQSEGPTLHLSALPSKPAHPKLTLERATPTAADPKIGDVRSGGSVRVLKRAELTRREREQGEDRTDREAQTICTCERVTS